MAFSRHRIPALLLGSAVVAAAPGAFAQVRPLSGEIGASAFQSAGVASAAPSPTLSPSAAAPLLAISPAPPVAAPVVVASPAPDVPTPAGRKNVSEESARASAGAAFDASGSEAVAGAGPVAGRETAFASGLGRASAVPADLGPREASLRDRVRDRMRYAKVLSRSFWWYMYTHIGDMWPDYKARWAGSGAAAASRPRAFFTAMRVTGMSGRFYALGGSALEDDLVIREFRAAFAKYFDAPGVGAPEREALERFMARAKAFNAGNRAHTNMYKNIRDPLIKASTMEPDRLAAYFDSLLPEGRERDIREFQKSGRMVRVREAFLRALRETLDEEDPNDPLRVRAAIVLGSFATGSAGPGSDFDVEALANGGDDARVRAFTRRLTDRWIAAGYHGTNPVSVHDHASWPSWGLVNIVQTRHYLVVSPEPALAARLSRQAFENPAVTLQRGYTFRGAVNRAAQRALVAAATYVSDAKAAFGIKSSP